MCIFNVCSYVYTTKKFVLLTNNLFDLSAFSIYTFSETVIKQTRDLMYYNSEPVERFLCKPLLEIKNRRYYLKS
jgi:hypothetical protein